jgi:hypothetical protein
MNEFDQFMKHTLRAEYYVRYTDDFLVVSQNEKYLRSLLPQITEFLQRRLRLILHPKKISIRSLYQGIDFLGYVVFSKYRLLRTKTRRRILKKLQRRVEEYRTDVITRETLEQSLQSYLGVLSHANSYKLSQEIKNQLWF